MTARKAITGSKAHITFLASLPGNPLRTPSTTLWHGWNGAREKIGRYQQVPFVWDEKPIHMQMYRNSVSPSYTGFVCFANEPTLPDQAWMTAEACAKLASDILDYTPYAKLIGPNHHPTIFTAPSDWMHRFCNLFLHGYGKSWKSIHAWGLHAYPHDSVKGRTPAQQVADFYALLPQIDVWTNKPIWVTEAGWKPAWGKPYEWGKSWFNKWLAIPKVEYVFGFIAVEVGGPGAGFGFYDDGAITDVGRGFRDAE